MFTQTFVLLLSYPSAVSQILQFPTINIETQYIYTILTSNIGTV